MNESDPTGGDAARASATGSLSNPLTAPITAGLLSWVALSIGFVGLKTLLQERPEFVGHPTRATQAELVQDSPQVVARRVNDDISVIKPVQPELSEIQFDMSGRRDYRGLRTILDMSGEFRARHVLTNAFEEPVFVLFKCAHPRSQNDNAQSLLAGELKLQTSTGGAQENTKDAWVWSGTIEPCSSTTVEVSYRVASLKGVTYRAGDKNGNQVKQLRVTFRQRDIPAMRIESGDGARRTADETVVWERRDFLAPDFFSAHIGESRSLHSSLERLLEIGPLICLLFLLSVSAILLARQKLTAVQMVTIAAGYAFYFPLMLYLSANFSFTVALVIAFAVPGALLANYARWLLGSPSGLIGGLAFLALYQVFPTLAAFAGWNRGMVLLCLGVVTLAVLINLQNRALRRRAAVITGLLMLFACPANTIGAEVQVTLPAELVTRLPESRREATNSLIAFEPAQYQVRQEANYFRVEARIPFQVLRAGETIIPLFGAPVHLQEVHFEPPGADSARLVTLTNQIGLFVQRTGGGALRLLYRAPVTTYEGRKRAQIPLALGPSGNVRLESTRNDLEILSGTLWAKNVGEPSTAYDIGVAGLEALTLEWRDRGSAPGTLTTRQAEAAKEFYGIGLTRAQNLTLINSDGSCTHFAEFDLPVSQAEEFRLKLPPKARLISVSVNTTEIQSPAVDDQLCRIRLPGRDAQQAAHRLSFRIAYPAVRLGFVGTVELALPEAFQTAGTLEWIVALPNGFDTQVIASGLETQKSAPDLSRFGDYGQILKSQAHLHLAKSLAPPGAVNLNLKYRQAVPGFYDARAE